MEGTLKLPWKVQTVQSLEVGTNFQ